MNLAIFDLDNTLIGGDSDYLWGKFLVEKELVDPILYERENQHFYDEYKAGTLDIYDFLEFSLAPLSKHSITTLNKLHDEFIQDKIEEIWLPKAEALLAQHRQNNDFLLIITATNHFVTAPIAKKLAVDDIIATMPEQINNQYTGKVLGIPCFQEGKVERLNLWLKEHDYSLDNSHFYSDSINDLPLLLKVSHPVAVDPDEKLEQYAKEQQWPIISLRD
ncbi:HAD family hydrolase [sulfur-oxidizing endosymbiont of Gigantopelta aegis]|uniref:histidinol-phosphatase n=1 Tax=sulfur-oxidizing endosymbiont of Gigantopelta aegis TaxID=2794934 RepID=UPI0018DC9333|nr:HAD family hydrolase [sulfur-oxidizing endosymbiont of Gigantopelta aegis]